MVWAACTCTWMSARARPVGWLAASSGSVPSRKSGGLIPWLSSDPPSRMPPMGKRAVIFGLVLWTGVSAAANSIAQQAPRALPHRSAMESLDTRPGATNSAHRFWDRRNVALFASVGAARALDYASTRVFRGRGVDEWLLSNSIVDNRPLFVGLEAAGTAASIGVSYLFHRAGHHKVESWVSIVHIGVGAAASARNFTLYPPTRQVAIFP